MKLAIVLFGTSGTLGAILGLIICATAPTQRELKDRHAQELESRLHVIEKDGHKWLLMDHYYTPTFTHHPDCPCGKAKP